MEVHSQLERRTKTRILSIDIFRAITMLLMIFVNDLWTLSNIPEWLDHKPADVDGLGLADIVFPAFLVIVGLSIPFAIRNRKSKGDDTKNILIHIAERVFALLLMGVYMVNFENINQEALGFNKYWWEILMAFAFVLIWNVYPENDGKHKLYNGLKFFGYAILVFLAWIYEGGTADNPIWMQTHWWGILGLIGWSYLLCSLAYLIGGNNLITITAIWVFFNLFNVGVFAGWLDFMQLIKPYVWIVGDGSMPALTMAGVLASVIYINFSESNKPYIFILIIAGMGLLSLAYGFGTRPFWGISKIQATPAWVGICTGISLLIYPVLFLIVDIFGKKNWAKIIKPAGTATLTCYLIPYFYYPVIALIGIYLPMSLRTGVIGLIKSFLFALFIILITGVLNRVGIKLKI
ncbi:heparan-alpha-glucosaminide N-acetyltransferase domain-containing protein [Flexithrix dorotheae]|uniref:heparan-alpha-glucosaminide N-acetyltransferase domain-containing protein n=1 Tax=Flexithrix dorotheae TaxID=70993 RepID=UPI0003AABD5A|nr:DUF5009 domain-containing protein [Flexithrix dorotheae]